MQVTLGAINLLLLLGLPLIPLTIVCEQTIEVITLWVLLVLWSAYHSETPITFGISCWVSFLIIFLSFI